MAKAGILCARGARNKQIAKRIATVTAVSPVLPPSFTPAPDSIYEVVFDAVSYTHLTLPTKRIV